MTRVLIPLAEGSEEMEAVISIDTLRRAKFEVVVAGISPGVITCSRGVKIVPDAPWEKIDPASFDIIVVPGGTGGVAHLRKDARVLEAVRQHVRAGKLVAAVCAGPLVLQDAGVLDGKKATCHPGVAQELTRANRLNEPVVEDGLVMTSQGAGTTMAFALAIVRRVIGLEKMTEVARGMVAWEMLGKP